MNIFLASLIIAAQLLPLAKVTNALSFGGFLPRTKVASRTVGVDLVGGPIALTPGWEGNYTRVNPLADGSLIAAYSQYLDDNTNIRVAKSTDAGSSWQAIGTVTTMLSAANDVDNPYILQLPSGRILVAMRNHSKDPNGGTYLYFRITICYSDDNGVSWSYLSTPCSDAAFSNGNWEPYLRNALDGSLQLYYSRETSVIDQDTLMRTSTDGGVTWSTATIISGAELSDSRDGMTGVATISGSSLIAVFESRVNDIYSINYITSSDDGKTWANRSPLYRPEGLMNSAGSPQVINVGGKLICSFMTDEDTGAHAWPNGTAAKLVISGDGGVTWGQKTTIFSARGNWPGLVGLDSSSFLYVADHEGAKAQKIQLS